MKKYGLLLILLGLIFVVGCFSDSYFQPLNKSGDNLSEEDELMKEIQEIEEALAGEGEETEIDTEDMEETGEDCVEVCETICEEVCTTDNETNETVCEEECYEECETVCEEAEVDEDSDETDLEDEEETDEEETEDIEEIETSGLQRLSVQETELVNLKLNVSDADLDQVTYTFSSPLNEEGKWQTDYGDAGEYIITITASDGTTTSEKKVLLVVEKKNVPPVIEGLESEITVDEGEIVSLEPQISDPNKDDIEVIFSEPLDEIGVWETDHTSAGVYDVTVTASDGEMQSEATVEITVRDVNVPPEIQLDVDETLTVKEGDLVEIQPEVTDLDGDEVTVTISEPVGDDGVWETGYTDHGEYEITITADDGKDITTKVITLIVEDVNVPPEIIDIGLI